MRLTAQEIKSIKDAFFEVFDDGRIYLFGSRVDDGLRGGDIDLYLCPKRKFSDVMEKKRDFLIKLDQSIGEQKIDVIIAQDKSSRIEQEAIRTGLRL